MWYIIASLTPAVLLTLACLVGGPFPVLAVLSITVVVFFMDKLLRDLPTSDRSGRKLSLTLAGVHFPLLALGIWSLANSDTLSLVDKLLIYTGLGLFFWPDFQFQRP